MIDKNKIIAHRGLHNNYIVENTLLAFLKAVEKDYAVELDIRLLKDGTVVVQHDIDLKRLTGINKLIESCTLKDISNIKINEKYYIPTLEQVLKLINHERSILNSNDIIDSNEDIVIPVLNEKWIEIIQKEHKK